MTLQEIFDKAATHLLTQNTKSVNCIGDCQYRGDYGNMCAAGVFIADSNYSPALEKGGVRRGDVSSALHASGFPTTNFIAMDVLSRLQKLHDGFEPAEWFVQLNRLATAQGLSIAVLLGWAK
jgi:hypothetical protein